MAKEPIKLKLGLDLEDYKYDARDCIGCAGCKWVDFIYMPGWDFSWKCPSWQKYQFDAYGACGRLKIAHDLIGERLDYSEPSLPEAIYACTLCGACDVGCKRNLDLEPLLTLESLRGRAVKEGIGPMPQQKTISDNIVKTSNRYGKPQADRLKWLPKGITPAAKADILYFAGCRASFANKDISQATARIFKAARADFMVMEDEPCCGNYLFTTGQLDKARALAKKNIEQVKKTGAKTIVFGCAEGYKTFKVDYPKLLGISTSDLPFQVQHMVEPVAEWVKDGRLKLTKPVNMKVTYHDSCNLGRLSEPWVHWEGERGDWSVYNPTRQIRRGTYGIYDQPRDILNAIPGIELVEMPRHHENAWCCGNAAGVREAFPNFSAYSADERLREARTTGAEAIVSACPGCRDNFSKSAGPNDIKAYDILELVAKAAK